MSISSAWYSCGHTMVWHGSCTWHAPTSKYLLVSVGITLASVGITGKAIWFNGRDLNGLLGQLGVSAKVTVLWNTGEWDSLIVGIPQCFNSYTIVLDAPPDLFLHRWRTAHSTSSSLGT